MSDTDRKGTAVANDCHVLAAHLELARRSRSLNYYASARQLAEMAGTTAPTACRSNKRLQKKGWLRLYDKSRQGMPQIWALSAAEIA